MKLLKIALVAGTGLVLLGAIAAGMFLKAGFESDTAPPLIQVWYGSHQITGRLGTPQKWINVLGNVSDAEGRVSELTYTLNGVPGEDPLTLGPNKTRLINRGDFNLELPEAALVEGLNAVVIRAVDEDGNESRKTVTVEHHRGNTWPLPYRIDWRTVRELPDVVQVLDGEWIWDEAGVRPHPSQIGYDRLLAIGDTTWRDYEVTLPITVHGLDRRSYLSRKSTGPGLGLVLRWVGHSNSPVNCGRPLCGWRPSGGSVWYAWRMMGPDDMSITGNPAPEETIRTDRRLLVGNTYWFKTRVETNASGSLYRLKVWENGQPEPAAWDLERQMGPDNHGYGSFLLNAHHVDVTFGNITVEPVGPGAGGTATDSTGSAP